MRKLGSKIAVSAWIIAAAAALPPSAGHAQGPWGYDVMRMSADFFQSCEMRARDFSQFLRAAHDGELPTRHLLQLICMTRPSRRTGEWPIVWIDKPTTAADAVWVTVFAPLSGGDTDIHRSVRRLLGVRPSELEVLVAYAKDAVRKEQESIANAARLLICGRGPDEFATAEEIRRAFAEAKQSVRAERPRHVDGFAEVVGAAAADGIAAKVMSAVGPTLPTLDTEALYRDLSYADLRTEAAYLCLNVGSTFRSFPRR